MTQKALVGRSEVQVKQAMRAFGLTEPEWFPMTIWGASLGRRFSRIVFLDLDPESPEQAAQINRRVNELRLRLTPDHLDEIYSL